MSNCVDVRNEVGFTSDYFDVGGLWADVQSAPDNPPSVVRGDEDTRNYFFSWFLKGAIRWKNGALIWLPGSGLSGHTWRDLRGTLHLIAKYSKCKCTVRLFMRDLDAPTDFDWCTFNIGPNGLEE